ncbi:MAG: hypothetical protein RRB13_12835 [bacterium]|nr:hypothetical protein [bacterium]
MDNTIFNNQVEEDFSSLITNARVASNQGLTISCRISTKEVDFQWQDSPTLKLIALESCDLEENLTFSGTNSQPERSLRFSGSNFAQSLTIQNSNLTNLEIKKCVVNKLVVSEVDIQEHLFFSDVVFEHPLHFEGCKLNHATFRNCTFHGLSLPNALAGSKRNISFENCSFENFSFEAPQEEQRKSSRIKWGQKCIWKCQLWVARHKKMVFLLHLFNVLNKLPCCKTTISESRTIDSQPTKLPKVPYDFRYKRGHQVSFVGCNLHPISLLGAETENLYFSSCTWEQHSASRRVWVSIITLVAIAAGLSIWYLGIPCVSQNTTIKFSLIALLLILYLNFSYKPRLTLIDERQLQDFLHAPWHPSYTNDLSKYFEKLEELRQLYQDLSNYFEKDLNDLQVAGSCHYHEMRIRYMLDQYDEGIFGVFKFKNLIASLYEWTGNFGENFARLGLMTFSVPIVLATIPMWPPENDILSNLAFIVYSWTPKSVVHFGKTPWSDKQLDAVQILTLVGGALVFLVLAFLFITSLRRAFKR